MFKRKCKITFIKHGTTINTEERRFFDDERFPAINETGRIEMENISEWIASSGIKTDKIYTSPALRCVQSTRILSDIYNQDFEILYNFTSRKKGIFNGLSVEEIIQKFPNKIEQFYQDAENYTPENAEPLIEFNKRINNIIQNIIKNNIHKRLIIITHGEIIQSAIANAIGIPLNNQFKIYIPAGSATQISYFEDFSSLIYSGYIPTLR